MLLQFSFAHAVQKAFRKCPYLMWAKRTKRPNWPQARNVEYQPVLCCIQWFKSTGNPENKGEHAAKKTGVNLGARLFVDCWRFARNSAISTLGVGALCLASVSCARRLCNSSAFASKSWAAHRHFPQVAAHRLKKQQYMENNSGASEYLQAANSWLSGNPCQFFLRCNETTAPHYLLRLVCTEQE